MTQIFLNSKDVLLHVYDECKYTASSETLENSKRIRFSYCTGFEIVSGEDAAEIEKLTDASCIDDYHEYLVLFFEDGNRSTFRNSYVDLFCIANSFKR